VLSIGNIDLPFSTQAVDRTLPRVITTGLVLVPISGYSQRSRHMNLRQRLSLVAAIVLLMSAGATATNEHWTVVNVPIDGDFNYVCIGENVHVTGFFRIEEASFTDGRGALHAQLLIKAEDTVAVGSTTGLSYRYTSAFKDVLYLDSDSAPAAASVVVKVVLAQQNGGPKLVMRSLFKVTIDAAGNLTVVVDNTADSCTP